MKKRALIVLMIMTLVVALSFSACSKETMTLEKYVSDNPDVQASIDEAMSGNNVVVEIKGNEIIYTFDLSKMDGYTEELAKSDAIKIVLGDALEAAGATFGNISKSVEDETGISGISTTVNYTWGDEVIVTQTFTSADAGASDDGAEMSDDAAETADDADTEENSD